MMTKNDFGRGFFLFSFFAFLICTFFLIPAAVGPLNGWPFGEIRTCDGTTFGSPFLERTILKLL